MMERILGPLPSHMIKKSRSVLNNSVTNYAIMWVEFVVGSLLCCDRFFSGYSGFPLSSKTNISKFNQKW